ncbi:hypothetical protein MGYG_04004 [Nannizzia gypsea CBS 118893]|uniref:Major facilitator superfamily (MFS) profile domain-containing protein n=1 Tax=Arthroderma gypseum (strain ATCC MYA-4604 / CBS 118893) TaxID=535722 RepID=E4UUN5_ARTGP|nr:hypothetical protein MGYG_04004 [Nannizzia gypsea CBS 118893]EFR01002.1 hypothetical protein MGYG_04004 [Nannizzia gypsea CBS 118893]
MTPKPSDNDARLAAPAEDQPIDDIDNGNDKYLTGVSLWLASISLVIPVFLSTLDATIVATAVPEIVSEFHSTLDIGWYSTAYSIANCAMLPMAGTLNTVFNIKIVFIVFLILFELGSALSGAATSSIMLIIGRAIAGMGAAGLYNGSMTMLTGAVNPKARAVQISVGTAVAASGTVFGPVIGGALTSGASWRWCFYINLPPGVITVLAMLFIRFPIRKAKDATPKTILGLVQAIDLVGFVLFAPTCVMLLLALSLGGTTYAWNSATIIGLFCGTVACCGVFLTWEHFAHEDAMIPLSLLKQSAVAFSALTIMFQFSGVVCLTYYLPIWFQTVKGITPLLSGVYQLPTIVSQTLFTVISGSMVATKGRYATPVCLIGCALTTIGAGLITTFQPDTSTAKWVGYQILLGAGRGLSLQIPLIVTQGILPPHMIPKGTSLILLSQFFGCSVFIASSQTIFSNQLVHLITERGIPNPLAVVHSGGLPATLKAMGLAHYLAEIALAYNNALVRTWYLSVVLAGCSFLVAFGMGQKPLNAGANVSNEEGTKALAEKEASTIDKPSSVPGSQGTVMEK